MTPLASIPEGSNSQPVSRFRKLNALENTDNDRVGPRSRLFVAPRRQTRARPQRTAPPHVALPVWYRHPLNDGSTERIRENIHVSLEATSDEHADPSDLSFDLSSFPNPPSSPSALSMRDGRPSIISDTSAIPRYGQEQGVHRTNKGEAHRPYFNDGANDHSVDSDLVDAITRNIVQQLRLSSMGRFGQNKNTQTYPVNRATRQITRQQPADSAS